MRGGDFFNCVKASGFPQLKDSDFYLTLVQRNCTPDTCEISGTKERLSNDPESEYFGDLYEWMSSRISVEARDRSAYLLRLDVLTNPDASVALTAAATLAQEVNHWLPDQSPADAQLQFVALLEQVRAARRKTESAARIPTYATAIVGLGRNDVLNVADAIQDPISAYALAQPDAVTRLTTVSNETARAEIYDCRYFEGQNALASINACSGFALNDRQLSSCLSGALCQPAIPTTARIRAILTDSPVTLDQIARHSPFPRGIVRDVGTLKGIYDNCIGSPDSASKNACVERQLFAQSASLRGLSNCLGRQSSDQQVRCALDSIQPDASKALDCAESPSTSGVMDCLTATYLPGGAQSLYACLSGVDAQDQLSRCAAGAGGEVGKLARCYQQDRDRLAVVACVAGDQIPKSARDAIMCAANNADSLTNAAVCLAGTQISPRLARQIGCITESESSPVAAGVCIATASMDLTPEQQIGLECLASSGGQPYVFAACVGGQLTMREMAKCRGKAFGEGDCFGDNNELQKLAKDLTGDTIHSDTVVGQIMTVEITPATYVCGVVQSAEEIGVGSISKSLDNDRDAVNDLVKGDYGGLARTAVNAIVSPVQDVVNFAAAVVSIF